MLENIEQSKFEHIIDILILYKQLNPKKDVYLSEKSVFSLTKEMKRRTAFLDHEVFNKSKHMFSKERLTT